MASKGTDKVRVTLAYAYPHDAEKPKYQADETVEFDPSTARQLIRDGYARPADETPTAAKKES